MSAAIDALINHRKRLRERMMRALEEAKQLRADADGATINAALARGEIDDIERAILALGGAIPADPPAAPEEPQARAGSGYSA